jgi:exodeoxyribonuclease III
MAAKKKPAQGWTLCTLNVGGIRSAERRGLQSWLAARRPDVLALQELRASEDQVPDELRSPAGYNTAWNSAEKKGYSGVAIYSRRQALCWRAGLELDWGDREGRVLRADFPDLSVISLYVPSGTTGEVRQRAKLEFLRHLSPWLKRLLAEGRPVAVLCDINIAPTERDIHDPKGNAKSSGFLPEERAWFARLLRQGWTDAVRAAHPDQQGPYSWWSHRGRARELDRGWRIDHILLSPALAARLEEAWIERDAGLSDHAPVWARFSP